VKHQIQGDFIMSMTISSSSANLSESGSRAVTLEVTGICNPNFIRTGTCTMTVPYNRLSQTIQGIHRLNGKVASVKMSSATTVATPKATIAQPRASEPSQTREVQSPKSKRDQKG
jgi:CpcD/allophycocyanin linker domain